LRPLLDAVVADRLGGAERLLDVVPGDVLDDARLQRVADPHAGVAVGLELDPYSRALRPGVAAVRALERARQVLDVMAVLVRDDVRLRKRAD
jgi:hypothetical protein